MKTKTVEFIVRFNFEVPQDVDTSSLEIDLDLKSVKVTRFGTAIPAKGTEFETMDGNEI